MQTILITGAAGGMGYAAAKRLALNGDTVIGLDLRLPEPVEGARFLQVDLTDPDAVAAVFGRLQKDGVRLDGVLHMAGMYELDSLVEMGEQEWQRVLAVNLSAAWRVNRESLPLLAPGAKIVLTTSELAPLYPLPFTGIYAVTKAALDKYADALRMELQLLGHPVVVLRPGAVDTGLLDVSTRRLDDFCAGTTHYQIGAETFRRVVNRVEARKIPPEQVAALAEKILRKKRPRAVYSINRNPLLLLLNALPKSWQRRIIRRLLQP